MEIPAAVETLSALAHGPRLTIFRMLVAEGPSGLPAGEIARRIGTPANTLSANLNVLSHAGLVASRRDGRSIVYSADYERMSALLSYLMEDCCGGAPEVCAPVAEVLQRTACCQAAPLA